MQELLAELKKLRMQLGEKQSREERTQSAFMAHDESDSEPEEVALAAVQHRSNKLRKKALLWQWKCRRPRSLHLFR